MKLRKIAAASLAAVACSLALGRASASPDALKALGAVGVIASADDDLASGDFKYKTITDRHNPENLEVGSVEITEYIGKGGAVNIPSEIDGRKVTSIGGNVFSNCGASITSITIPDSVKQMGRLNYNSYHVLNIFADCINLNSINVDENNTKYYSVDGVLFERNEQYKSVLCVYPRGKKAKSYTIPNDIAEIDDYAFLQCTNLVSVTIPDSINKINFGAFMYCTGLGSVTIPDSIKEIESNVFAAFTGLASVTIPDSITSIGAGAFNGCTGLTSITIPDSVTSIGDSAFYECTGLTSVTIPKNVTSMRLASAGCTSLTAINVDKANEEYCSENGIVFSKDKTKLICYPARKTAASYTIPNSVTDVDGGSFFGCDYVTDINVGKENEHYCSVDGVLFTKNKRVLVYYPTGRTATGYTIPDSVTRIGGSAFADCKNLVSVNIPNSLKALYDSAFFNCVSLSDIYYNGTKEEWKTLTSSGHFWTGIDYGVHHYPFSANFTPNIHCTDGVIAATGDIPDVNNPNTSDTSDTNTSDTSEPTSTPDTSEPTSTPDTSAPTSNEKTYTPTVSAEGADEETKSVLGGITVTDNNGAFEDGVAMNVKAVESTDSSFSFEITFTKDGKEVQPNGKVNVRVPLPEKLKGGSVFVYHGDAYIESTRDGDYVVFKTDSFSPFTITSKNTLDPGATDANSGAADTDLGTTDTNSNVSNNDTDSENKNDSKGDSNPNTGIAFAAVPALLACAAVVVLKKRR